MFLVDYSTKKMLLCKFNLIMSSSLSTENYLYVTLNT